MGLGVPGSPIFCARRAKLRPSFVSWKTRRGRPISNFAAAARRDNPVARPKHRASATRGQSRREWRRTHPFAVETMWLPLFPTEPRCLFSFRAGNLSLSYRISTNFELPLRENNAQVKLLEINRSYSFADPYMYE